MDARDRLWYPLGMPHLQPPAALPTLPWRSVFLAGSIEMGACANWQQDMAQSLLGADPSITVLNPRRPDWDASWQQDIVHPQFRAQVNWELDALKVASAVAFYFDPATHAPVSLLELGLMAAARSERVVVCCPPGYWRRGNVQVVCARHAIPLVETLAQMEVVCLRKIHEFG